MDVPVCTASSSTESAAIQSRTRCSESTRRRRRTTFTPSQLRVLEDVFSRQQYLVGNERLRLAALLNIGVTQVKVWFQNRRIRWRREQREMLIRARPQATTTAPSADFSLTPTTGVAHPDELLSSSTLSEMQQKSTSNS